MKNRDKIKQRRKERKMRERTKRTKMRRGGGKLARKREKRASEAST